MDKSILVNISKQKLYLIEKDKVIREYPVSTSMYGTGNKEGSYKTPLGLHRVYRLIGKGLKEDTVFVGRKPAGKIRDLRGKKEDAITARIIWLEGLEEGINRGKGVDTRERYIYIHGTLEETKIGIPSSKGCIRMRNKDIVELFDLIQEGMLVKIVEDE